MELRDYMRVLFKHWIGILLITTLVTAAVAGWTSLQPRVYTASAQTFVAITTPVTSQGLVDVGVGGAVYTIQRLTSYIQLIDSPEVLQPVIDELGLEVSVGALAEGVSASNPVDTVLINVSVSDLDPQAAAMIANAVALRLGNVIQILETSATGEIVPVKATLTNPARPPGVPSSPRTRVNLLLGFLIGLALGVGYAFLRQSLNTTVKNPEELMELTGTNPLGVVAFDSGAKKNPVIALDSRTSRAEAFRTIRTNLQYVDVDNPPRVVVITSSVPMEGKSTTAVNLAITMAQAGRNVVLVEADLRLPKTSIYLGIEPGLGLTDVLAGQATLAEALLPWNRGLITVLPAGHNPSNPSELLASRQFAKVIATLRADFDSVIIDATPLLHVTDAAIVSKAADGAILLVHFGKTTREQVASSIAALDQVEARLLGTVLNFIPTGRRGYGYKYGYGYGYGSYESETRAKPDDAATDTNTAINTDMGVTKVKPKKKNKKRCQLASESRC